MKVIFKNGVHAVWFPLGEFDPGEVILAQGSGKPYLVVDGRFLISLDCWNAYKPSTIELFRRVESTLEITR